MQMLIEIILFGKNRHAIECFQLLLKAVFLMGGKLPVLQLGQAYPFGLIGLIKGLQSGDSLFIGLFDDEIVAILIYMDRNSVCC